MIQTAARKGHVKVDIDKYGLDLGSVLSTFIFKTMLFPLKDGSEGTFILPNEIREQFLELDGNSLKETVKQNSKLMKIVRGLVYYYGVLEIGQLYQMVIDLGMELDFRTFHHLIKANESIDNCIELKHHYIHQEGIDPYNVLEAIEEREKQFGPSDYKKLEMKAILTVNGPEYYIRTREIVTLEKTINKYFELNNGQMKHFISDLMFLLDEMDDVGELSEFIAQAFDCPDLEVVNEILMAASNVYNAHRQWVLKGYSPKELRQTETVFDRPHPVKSNHFNNNQPQKKVKIGRNEPCPCGSGKKYKKCCGK